MQINLPDDIGLSAQEIKQELAIALYERSALSLARAAELCGMTRLDFQRLLASRERAVHYTEADVDHDIGSLQRLDQGK